MTSAGDIEEEEVGRDTFKNDKGVAIWAQD